MKDPRDLTTIDFLAPKRTPGRPPMYLTDADKKAAAAEAARRYRERVRAEKAARRASPVAVSKIIDLSSLSNSSRNR